MSRLLAFAASAALVVAVAPAVLADERPAPDVGKRIAEASAEELLKGAGDGVSRRDIVPATANRVAPGAVRWHTDLEAAREASLSSGRPVLLFQLLGRLDEEFC